LLLDAWRTNSRRGQSPAMRRSVSRLSPLQANTLFPLLICAQHPAAEPRRTKVPWALAIFQDLTQHGYDMFFDFQGIASGDFEHVILENIRARAHFLVLLAPTRTPSIIGE
jgi:hypothetical protein